MDNYEVIRHVNKGSFGSAILVRSRRENKQYIMKQIDIGRLSKKEREDATQEVTLLSRLKNPNIVEYHDSFVHKDMLCIVMQYAECGDLHNKLQSQKGKLLPEDEICDLFLQICLAMKYVHDNRILHRDIKSQNIFLTANHRVVKLGDFGIAKVLKSTMECARTAIGTPYYLSPEICEGRPYGRKSDVWALGVVLYEMCTLKCPFDGANMKNLVLKILKGVYPPVSGVYSAPLRNLIAKMLQKEARDRPTVAMLLSTPPLCDRMKRFVAMATPARSLAPKPQIAAHSPANRIPTVAIQSYETLTPKADVATGAAAAGANQRLAADRARLAALKDQLNAGSTYDRPSVQPSSAAPQRQAPAAVPNLAGGRAPQQALADRIRKSQMEQAQRQQQLAAEQRAQAQRDFHEGRRMAQQNKQRALGARASNANRSPAAAVAESPRKTFLRRGESERRNVETGVERRKIFESQQAAAAANKRKILNDLGRQALTPEQREVADLPDDVLASRNRRTSLPEEGRSAEAMRAYQQARRQSEMNAKEQELEQIRRQNYEDKKAAQAKIDAMRERAANKKAAPISEELQARASKREHDRIMMREQIRAQKEQFRGVAGDSPRQHQQQQQQQQADQAVPQAPLPQLEAQQGDGGGDGDPSLTFTVRDFKLSSTGHASLADLARSMTAPLEDGAEAPNSSGSPPDTVDSGGQTGDHRARPGLSASAYHEGDGVGIGSGGAAGTAEDARQFVKSAPRMTDKDLPMQGASQESGGGVDPRAEPTTSAGTRPLLPEVPLESQQAAASVTPRYADESEDSEVNNNDDDDDSEDEEDAMEDSSGLYTTAPQKDYNTAMLCTIDENEEEDFNQMVEEMKRVTLSQSAMKAGGVSAADDDDDDDDEYVEADSTPRLPVEKFMLGGATLKFGDAASLTNASVHTRIETLRLYLETELGLDVFLQAYRVLKNVADSDCDEDVTAQLSDILGPTKVDFFSVIVQLIICEDSLYG